MDLPFRMIPYRPLLQNDFYRLNAAWIEPNFGLEEEDVLFLKNPQREILDKGGAVFFAIAGTPEQESAVGTGALFKMDNETYELIRLSVDEQFRGHGLGKALVQHSLQLAQEMGAQRVILETSLHPVNATALKLYESLGFRHYEPRPEHRSALARAQVWMVFEPLPQSNP